MNKKGFTLVEMIVVVILIGVIAIVAVPAVLKTMNKQDNERYDTHMKLVKQALDLYEIRYKGDFDNSSDYSIYRINYQKLLDNDLLKENGLKCSGYIDLTKKKNNNYAYKYYLTCKDDKTHEILGEDGNKNVPPCNSSNKCVTIGG